MLPGKSFFPLSAAGADKSGAAGQSTLVPRMHWLASSAVVWLAVALATQFVPLCEEHPKAIRRGIIDGVTAWDGQWYATIAADGYAYDRNGESNIAFFPAFPLLGRGVAQLAGVRVEFALLLVSSAACVGAFLMAGSYVRAGDAPDPDSLARAVTVAMAWFPTTFYFRMAYSESLFLLLLLAAMYGMRRGWPRWRLVAVVGLATAARPVGLALLAPLALHLLRRADRRATSRCTVALTILIACWGLLLFIGFQAYAFGEPLAFAKAQARWTTTVHRHYGWERAARLLTLEPIRAVYDSTSSFYWGLRAPHHCALFNMMFANPIYFLLTAATIAVGRIKRWVTNDETVLSALLLAIPYLLQADRCCMASQARFASVVFPAYIVWGRVLIGLPRLLARSLCALSGILMALYAALFSSWYWFY